MQQTNYIPAFWYMSNNFGDCLNHFLIQELSGKQPLFSQRDKDHYIICGSIFTECNEKSTIWGAGFSYGHVQNFTHFKK